MKTLIYILLASLIFISCRKESLTFIDETETETPQPVEGAFFKGVVISTEGTITDVTVEIYQHEKLAGTRKTDQNGNFNTLGIKLDTQAHVTFAVKHPDFNIRARRVNGSNKKQDIGSIILSRDEKFNADQPYLTNAGSNDLISVSGYVRDTKGAGIAADVAIIYDIRKLAPGTYDISGDIVPTDETGYYELLLPKNEQFYYFVSQNSCDPVILTKDRVRIFDGQFPAELIGPFENDTELPALNNGLHDIEGVKEQTVSFIAYGLQCDGNIVPSGSMNGKLMKGSQTFDFKIQSTFGLLWLNKSFCIKKDNLNKPWKVSFHVIDYSNNKISEEFEFNITEENQDLGSINVCHENLTDQPYVHWSIGIIPFYYEISPGFIDNTGALISSQSITQSNGNLRFTIPGFASGNNKLRNFTFNGALVGEQFSFSQKSSDDITVTYRQTNDPKIIRGDFEGNLTNTTTNVAFPVKGTFLVKLP